MKKIISPIDPKILEKELNEDKFLRRSNYGDNEIYVITHHDSPNVMLEIGRLREEAFRLAGGGTGKDADIDSYDIQDNPYKQLISWDPEGKVIMGGYRYQICQNESNPENLATSKLFNFSNEFTNDYLPYMIELGRSFIQPTFQSTNPTRKAIFALDNLWDGLGALVVENPEIKYFFGKVTMYTHFNKEARNMILYFLEKSFPEKKHLLTPKMDIDFEMDIGKLEAMFTSEDYKENYKILSKNVRSLDENIPPLINAYMNLSPTMKVFGTVINKAFGHVEETGIMITNDDIYPEKKERHIQTYLEEKEARK